MIILTYTWICDECGCLEAASHKFNQFDEDQVHLPPDWVNAGGRWTDERHLCPACAKPPAKVEPEPKIEEKCVECVEPASIHCSGCDKWICTNGMTPTMAGYTADSCFNRHRDKCQPSPIPMVAVDDKPNISSIPKELL